MTKLSKGRGPVLSERSESKGFTLIELLLVVAIIIIIASLVIVSVSNARIQGRDSKRIADLARIQLALESYKDANSSYPQNISMDASCWTTIDPRATQQYCGTPQSGCTAGNFQTSIQSYLSPLPTDPINRDFNKYVVRFFTYPTTATPIVKPDRYWLTTRLEDSSNPNINQPTNCYEIYGGNTTTLAAPPTGMCS